MSTVCLLTSLSIAMTLTTSAAMGQTRVCRLLKVEDVNAVFASTFMQGDATRTPTGDSVCPFMNTKEYGISIALVEKGGAERFARKQAQSKRASHVTAEDIAGLGDKALYTHTSSIDEITVLKGDIVIGIAIGPDPAAKTRLEELARRALARLESP